MSLQVNGSSQYVYIVHSAPKAYPYSIGGWIKDTTALAANSWVAGYSSTSVEHQNCILSAGAAAGDPASASTYASAWASALTSTGISSSTWHHVLAVFNSSTDRRVYIDGGSKGTDTTSQSATNENRFCIGARLQAAADLYFTGYLAEFGIWNSALSDANAVTLAGGAVPTDVDSGNIIEYWSLLADANSDGGTVGTNLTEVGTPSYSGDHPSVGTNYVELAGTTGIIFGSTASLTQHVSLAGTAGITFGSTAVLTFGPLSSAKAERIARYLVMFGNDSATYESS